MRRIVGWSSNFVKSDPGTAKLMGKAFGKAPPVMSLSEDGETDLEAVIPAKPDVVIAQMRAHKSFKKVAAPIRLTSTSCPARSEDRALSFGIDVTRPRFFLLLRVSIPRVLLLDEPTSALDVAHQIRGSARSGRLPRNRDHLYRSPAQSWSRRRWCNRLVLLSGGRVVSDGEPHHALTPDVLNQVYGGTGRIERCSRGFIRVLIDEGA